MHFINNIALWGLDLRGRGEAKRPTARLLHCSRAFRKVKVAGGSRDREKGTIQDIFWQNYPGLLINRMQFWWVGN